MKVLIFTLMMIVGSAASAELSTESTNECISDALESQIRTGDGTKFEVTSTFSDLGNVDMTIAISHPHGFISQGFVLIKNGDYQNAYFIVPGIKPQPVNLSDCK